MAKITVVGIGYVGLSNATILAQKHQVTLVDIDPTKVSQVNQRQSPIDDPDIKDFFETKELNLSATADLATACGDADFIIIATPTNYDEVTGFFDTSSVDSVLGAVPEINPTATIIIKSTIPIGFTEDARKRFETDNIIFSPEFLREGRALYDNLHPARIIVGDTTEPARQFADLLRDSAVEKDVPVLVMESAEAEAVKLFANTYLAMRVAFFNELDTYAEIHGLDTAAIIKGVSSDSRIGDYYNNPSFGYGGYCLPKDTKQLLSNFKDVPHNLIQAVVDSNATRMRHIADTILSRQPKTVGIYRLTMKTDSDNFRQSAILTVIEHLLTAGIEIIIYEPTVQTSNLSLHENTLEIVNDLGDFKGRSDVVIANRLTAELNDITSKLYSRDLFGAD